MSLLERRAERIKLEKLLGEDPGALEFLDRQPVSALASLRGKVSATLFDSHSGMFERLAGSGKLLPTKISAVVAEKALGPMLCGRVAGHTPVERAVALAEKLNVRFMADVSTQMDPRRVRPLLQGISEKHIRAVSRELAHRNDVITMGRFIDALPVETTERVMEDLQDDGLLLRVAYFAEDKDHLTRVVRLLSRDHLRRIISVAREEGLWYEALALMYYVDPQLSHDLSALAADVAGFYEGLVEVIHADGLWEDALAVVGEMSPESRRQLLGLPLLRDEEVIRGLMDSARDHDLWAPLAAIREDMNPQARKMIAGLATEYGDQVPEALREP